jgi:hypothetical protein
VLCRTEPMGPTGTAGEPLIINPMADIHPMDVHSMVMVLSLGQAVVDFHGAEAVAEYSVAGEGSVAGSEVQVVAWGPRWNQWGLDIQSP